MFFRSFSIFSLSRSLALSLVCNLLRLGVFFVVLSSFRSLLLVVLVLFLFFVLNCFCRYPLLFSLVSMMMVVLFVTIWCRRVCACEFFFHSCASVFSFIVFLWLFLCIFMLNSDKQSSHRHHERKGRVAQCRTNSRMQSKRRLR